MKDVLLLVARRYNGHELWTALGVLADAGKTFEVISTDLEVADELTGRRNVLERTLDSVDPEKVVDEFNAFMIVSGNMKDTEAYWDDPQAQALVRAFDFEKKPLAAICCSVPSLWQVVEGVQVSFFPLVRSRQKLRLGGANLSTLTVSVDGRVVTAENQMATTMWAEMFVKVLNGEDVTTGLVDSGFTPHGRERKPIAIVEQIKERRARENGTDA